MPQGQIKVCRSCDAVIVDIAKTRRWKYSPAGLTWVMFPEYALNYVAEEQCEFPPHKELNALKAKLFRIEIGSVEGAPRVTK